MKKILFIYLASISMFSFSAEIIGGITNTIPESFDVTITSISSKNREYDDLYYVKTNRSTITSYLDCRENENTLAYLNEFSQRKVFNFSKREECLVVVECLNKNKEVNLSINTENLDVRTIDLPDACYSSSTDEFRWVNTIEFDEDEQYI